jgi:hypothetical protein
LSNQFSLPLSFPLSSLGKLSAYYYNLPTPMRTMVDKVINSIPLIERWHHPMLQLNNIFFGLAAMEIKWCDISEKARFNLLKSTGIHINRDYSFVVSFEMNFSFLFSFVSSNQSSFSSFYLFSLVGIIWNYVCLDFINF